MKRIYNIYNNIFLLNVCITVWYKRLGIKDFGIKDKNLKATNKISDIKCVYNKCDLCL